MEPVGLKTMARPLLLIRGLTCRMQSKSGGGGVQVIKDRTGIEQEKG